MKKTARIFQPHLIATTLLLYCGLSDLQAEENKEGIGTYMQISDDSYDWTISSDRMIEDFRFIVVRLTSQSWLTLEQVDRVEWQHWMELYIPDELASNVAFLFITGGSNASGTPSQPDSTLMQIAQTTGNVVVKLAQVPNQPLTFMKDGQGRTEDDLIAFSWVQFLKTKETQWIAQNAMVKSAVRAMDSVTEVLATERAGQISVEEFVIGGGSKRGWTTWLTAAVDPRVTAIVPLVFDALNTRPSMRHHFESYGFWSVSIGDYVNHGIMQKLQSEELDELIEFVDPYVYRQRLNMPKFLVNSAGDQFFLPDSSQFYWDGLSAPKYLRYIPNTDHSLDGSDAVESIAAFLALATRQQDIPSIEWTREGANNIAVRATQKPVDAKVWSAHNANSRDFRLLPSGDRNELPRGPTYSERSLEPTTDSGLDFHAVLIPEEHGWTAWFVEFTFDVGLPVPLKLTTNVQVTPDTLPFADKDNTQDTYLTIHCAGLREDADVAKRVLEYLSETIESQTLDHVDHLGRDYYHWKPTKDIRVEGTAVSGFLESVGYEDCRYQLESGKGPTLPPQAEERSE